MRLPSTHAAFHLIGCSAIQTLITMCSVENTNKGTVHFQGRPQILQSQVLSDMYDVCSAHATSGVWRSGDGYEKLIPPPPSTPSWVLGNQTQAPRLLWQTSLPAEPAFQAPSLFKKFYLLLFSRVLQPDLSFPSTSPPPSPWSRGNGHQTNTT